MYNTNGNDPDRLARNPILNALIWLGMIIGTGILTLIPIAIFWGIIYLLFFN